VFGEDLLMDKWRTHRTLAVAAIGCLMGAAVLGSWALGAAAAGFGLLMVVNLLGDAR
jgi:hypothetical protein